MPPRIPHFQCLHAQNAAKTPTNFIRTFSSSPSTGASTVTQRRRRQDPWALAQAKAKKAANLSRQEVLKKERAVALGDPVRGITTPYVKSFDNAIPDVSESSTSGSPQQSDTSPAASTDEHLNYFLTKSELEAGLEYSKWLSRPSATPTASEFIDSKTPAERETAIRDQQTTAAEALTRIANLSLSSSKDRMRVNKQRIIHDFGRHTTDLTLPPRPASVDVTAHNALPKTPRVGPDTGSSEVQIAILTAKIRTLADVLETRGKQDKHNKRNLRLLVHRRAKLLKYLRKKERGGPRWQNLVDTLGLTEGTWKGEITIMGPLGGHSAVRLAKLQPPSAA